MLLKIPGTLYEIDTAHYSNGDRWIDLWEGNKKVAEYKTFEEVVENIHVLCNVDEEGMAKLQGNKL